MKVRNKTLLLAAAGAALIGLLVWLALPAPAHVETARVTRGLFQSSIEEDGVTRVRDRYVVAAPVAGLLTRPSLRVGDAVHRGDAVAVIVPNAAQMFDARTRAELAARVEAASAQASRARAVVRQAEASLVQAEDDHRRIAELAARGFASKTEQERAAVTRELRRKDVEAARFEADAFEHDLAQARAAAREGSTLRDAQAKGNAWTLRAPIDGTVLRVVQESEVALTVGAPILEIGDLSRLEARIDVLSTEATRIEPQAYVSLDAGGVKLAGRVRRIEPSGYLKVSALGIEEQRVDVLVDLLPNPAALPLVGDGYRVDAAIEVAREENALLVPLAALFRDGEDWAAFRVVGGRARLTRLRIGQRGAEQAVVLGGLPDDATVVVYPSDAVRDGTRVRGD
ncbi:MAG TPA: HlyD family efflux transporter periplasmic adaptor subunit [Steroidobacteraceae bacterium]|nr:HlyD family efflux transporter periplasmic adaptor subunit [Steroidobacteraceae bacterium]